MHMVGNGVSSRWVWQHSLGLGFWNLTWGFVFYCSYNSSLLKQMLFAQCSMVWTCKLGLAEPEWGRIGPRICFVGSKKSDQKTTPGWVKEIRKTIFNIWALCLASLPQSCPRVGWTRGSGRVGSGRVGSGHDFAGFWRVGSGQHFGFFSFLLIISWFLNRYESSNTTFGLIDFLRYLIYNN